MINHLRPGLVILALLTILTGVIYPLAVTGPVPYNAAASSGSNYGPLKPALVGPEGMVQARITALEEANEAAGVVVDEPIPIDLVTASGSGLDPHVSPAAALYQGRAG